MDVPKVMIELQNYKFNEWDIRDLFRSAVKGDIKKDYNLHIKNEEIVESDTIANTVITTVEALEKKYGSVDNARLHHAWSGVASGIRIDDRDAWETRLYVWSHRMAELIFMLRYAINGVLDESYAECQKFMAQNNLTYDTDKGTFTIGNVTVIVFKNHKVVLKKMTDEQYERMKNAFDNFKKHGNY